MTPLLRFSLATCAACVLSVSAFAADPAIIAKARAYLGSDSALDGMKSVHMVGTLETADSNDATKNGKAQIDIIFQKPEQQRIMATSDKLIEVTALNGYDAWQRFEDPKDASKWRQTLLGPEQSKRLRANTWQNLSFYRNIERVGGSVEDQGPVTMDGVACQKLVFTHYPGITFTRYFEVATGRLVHTETDNGNSIMREAGELRVDGIRFPKTVTQTSKVGNITRTATITFDKITINETFPESTFATPAVRPPVISAPSAPAALPPGIAK